MSKVTFLCSMLIMMLIPAVLGDQGPQTVVIEVKELGAPPNKTMGPKLMVVLCNRGKESVFIRRSLGFVGDYRFLPLRADVWEADTGKPACLKRIYRHVRVQLEESDFIALEPNYCYGANMDLRDEYVLTKGKVYYATFTYSSLAPKQVGRIKPWPGKVKSPTFRIVIGR